MNPDSSPLLISAATAKARTGMSWQWCIRFAQRQNVRILRVGPRKQLINAAELLAAIERVSAAHTAKPEAVGEQEIYREVCAELGLVHVTELR